MKRLSFDEGLKLFKEAPLTELQKLANESRFEKNPNKAVTFVLDTNPNYTNVCNVDCTFCSFYRKKGAEDAYTKSVEEVMVFFEKAKRAKLTTVLLQGGVHPDLPLSYYTELIRTARKRYPEINPHCFSAPEIYNLSKLENLSYKQIMQALYDAGQRTFPGGGAEILSEKVRKRISPKKMDEGAWLEIHRAAHQVGFKSTATMMYGHVETAEDILIHLEALRSLQDETEGFTAFIPWSYKRIGNALGRRRDTWAGSDAYLRMISFSRIFLDNFKHIQASWFSEGKETGCMALDYGADDFGGILIDEEVHAATEFVSKTTVKGIIDMIHSSGYDAVERNTFYDLLKHYSKDSTELSKIEVPIAQEPTATERQDVLSQSKAFTHSFWEG